MPTNGIRGVAMLAAMAFHASLRPSGAYALPKRDTTKFLMSANNTPARAASGHDGLGRWQIISGRIRRSSSRWLRRCKTSTGRRGTASRPNRSSVSCRRQSPESYFDILMALSSQWRLSENRMTTMMLRAIIRSFFCHFLLVLKMPRRRSAYSASCAAFVGYYARYQISERVA